MRGRALLICLALLLGLVGFFLAWNARSRSRSRNLAKLLPAKVEFTASRSTEDPADVEVTEVAFILSDGSRRRPNASTVCYVRAGGKEQVVATLSYG